MIAIIVWLFRKPADVGIMPKTLGCDGPRCLTFATLFRRTVVITEGIQWNYTSILNIIFLVLAALLVIRFIRTGGLPMLGMKDTP